jgi:glycosyltransferase involved in cell wall biosynthesis
MLNAIDLADFTARAASSARRSLHEELELHHDTKIVLFAGRITAQKDPMTFLRVAERFKDRDVAFVLAGSGELERRLRAFAQTRDLRNVHFLGYREDLPALMAEADALLLPSVSEPFGRVMLEAMAVGCPVIATRCYGPETVIRDGANGFLAPIGDDAAIAGHLDFLLNHPEETKSIVESARTTSRQYDIKEYMQRMKGVYERAIGDGRIH